MSKSKSPSPSSGAGAGATPPVRNYRYSIETLRELSKLSDSRKPPMVPCQKGDCISQLFVSRQQQQQQHHAHAHTHSQQFQQYQHMSFNESLDYVPGKRGGRGHGANKKHHDGGHQQMGPGGMGNMGGGGGGGGPASNSNQRHMDIIRVQLSLKEEIKLSECENAWQPVPLRRTSMAAANQDGEDSDVEGVLKKVRGILNKLTPDNFEVLLKEMSSIKMDNEAKMTNVSWLFL